MCPCATGPYEGKETQIGASLDRPGDGGIGPRLAGIGHEKEEDFMEEMCPKITILI